MASVSIDLNADLGEGFGRWQLTDDEQLLSVVTSANVACGFHAGDAATMRRVCAMAAERDVRIGAQVSYRDLAGFGRRAMDVPPDELAAEVAYQIGALEVFARAAGTRVSYVKPHGALYNRVVHDEDQARAVVDGVLLADGTLPVLGLPGSRLLEAAEKAGLPVVTEAFADRAYTAQGTLVPRRQDGAVVTDPEAVVERSVRLARSGIVTSHTGEEIAVRARSLCLHGDTPGAVGLARRVRAQLESAGVQVEAFA
ncbi:LamB/YcsF family protein [Streptomyces sp. PSKA54]|uniref:5-oxoprolinase subunit A n=1 Tax=Streptomyces himalayensis subsp. aureolus TaxID=2758039 RepID=A0A7W2CZY3_9ACTN|nr:5-oxoprolinase subunit PxpA [Streptomyces himalayensis]MBA4862057.1 LamB/YcsF family protein [Streptomyces himalayensis subsp. aureolus]